MSTERGLTARVVVVTGAAQGQGAAHVQALADAGACVIAIDAKPFEAADPSVTTRLMDVTDEAAWHELATWLEADFGRVDGLVNNAAIVSRQRLGALTASDWQRVLSVNVTGAMLGIQTLRPLMGDGASIVNIGSSVGQSAHYAAAYATSKWALRGLTHVAAMELGPHGIRVNIVHPGYIETPMTAASPTGSLDAVMALTPLGRPGRPEEVSAAVLFLLSPESAFVHGAEIAVDGGYVSGGSGKVLVEGVAGLKTA